MAPSRRWMPMPAVLAGLLATCRNLFDPEVLVEAGFTYVPTGLPAVNR